MRERVDVYRSGLRKDWYWRYVAGNGRILADGSEGYSNLNDLLDSLATVTGSFDIEATKVASNSQPVAFLLHRDGGVLSVNIQQEASP